jgi:HEAT repeat protein
MRVIGMGLLGLAVAGICSTGAAREGAGPPSMNVPGERATAGAAISEFPGDPADSLYRVARGELNAGNYQAASKDFRRVRTQYPASACVSESMYWEAYALSKTGTTQDAREALAVLDQRSARFPRAANPDDARDLAVRIQGRLARTGDAAAARATMQIASSLATGTGRGGASGSADGPAVRMGAICGGGNDDRLMALNAVAQVSGDRAMPILRQVLMRRDAGSACLRRTALFILAQHVQPRDAEDVLLSTVRDDPSGSVRAEAVFWLSQVHTTHTVTALDSILRTTPDHDLQRSAIYALSQQDDHRAAVALETYIGRTDVSNRDRGEAIYWLGQDAGATQYLEDLFARTQDVDVKKRILSGIGELHAPGRGTWLLAVAQNSGEPVDARTTALFWAARAKAVSIPQLTGMYRAEVAPQMKRQVLYVLGQYHDPAAVDALMEIARTENDPEVRRDALFWLRQSNDPRVEKFLTDLDNR